MRIAIISSGLAFGSFVLASIVTSPSILPATPQATQIALVAPTEVPAANSAVCTVVIPVGALSATCTINFVDNTTTITTPLPSSKPVVAQRVTKTVPLVQAPIQKPATNSVTKASGG